MQILKNVVPFFFPGATKFETTSLRGGHINDTFKLQLADGTNYLIQRINHQVFLDPPQVCQNYLNIFSHLQKQDYPYKLPELQLGDQLKAYYKGKDGSYWRILTYLENTHVYEMIADGRLVEDASRAIAMFLKYLNTTPLPEVEVTIPGFHNSVERFQKFKKSYFEDPKQRAKEAIDEINFLLQNNQLFEEIAQLDLPERLVHNDTKLSNVLFDSENKVSAVIDWDTVMPGSLISDFGDIVRSMAVSSEEDEADLEKIKIDTDYFEALCKGFLEPLQETLNRNEKKYLFQGVLWIVLEQMMRFLTDFIEGDLYYKVSYEGHNLVRARNQMALFKKLKEEERNLERIIQKYV